MPQNDLPSPGLAVSTPTPARGSGHPLLGKTTQTVLVMLACLAVPYVASGARMRALRVVAVPWEHDEVAVGPEPRVPRPDGVPTAARCSRQGETKLEASGERWRR